MIPVAIVDDEPLARHKLKLFFEALPDFRVCGEADDARSAFKMIAQTKPRLLCLDVRLPGMSGLDVLRHVGPSMAVILTTAFDQYAVSAFELAAVDYLLKPFSRERFVSAVERARVWLTALDMAADAGSGNAPAERYIRRLFVRDRGMVVPIPVDAINHCEASDDTVILHANGRQHRMQITLSELASRLDPAMFLRVHRCRIVNLDHVAAMRPLAGARFALELRDGTSIEVSRKRSRLLRAKGL